jgi:5-oxoprolinase (ATP-hydrolysing) subunit A
VVEAVDGSSVRVEARSICVHGDTPGAVEIARAVREKLEDAGVPVGPFA